MSVLKFFPKEGMHTALKCQIGKEDNRLEATIGIVQARLGIYLADFALVIVAFYVFN